MASETQPDIDGLLEKLKSNIGVERQKAAEGLERAGVVNDTILGKLRNVRDHDSNYYVAEAAKHAVIALEAAPMTSEANGPSSAPATSQQQSLLAELVALQKQQLAMVTEIRKQTGCLYAYMIISIILGVLSVAAIPLLRLIR